MNITYSKIYSESLGREIEYKIYGHGGKPIIVFPSSGGRFYEYEDFGMVGSISDFIEEGKIILITPDSIDSETWLNYGGYPADRARRHNAYDNFIINELIPTFKNFYGYSGKFGATGCSMGGYHTLNFYLKHPDVFDIGISLSGIYDLRLLTGEALNEFDVYLNSPVDYLKNLSDPWFLEQYRQNHLILCTGLGRWEETTIKDTLAMKQIFEEKNIPAWIDFWGNDVDHDWPWWRIQMPYFLNELVNRGII